jgi:nitroimidazol reductase NimA-like FMN-containing flavoprotein (pyridoxamine 5'-phosphate oxidase superfamily)
LKSAHHPNSRATEIDEQQRENPAWQTLSPHPMWQEPGTTAWAARPHHNSTESLIPIYYRIKIDHVTGHQATQDVTNLISPTTV